MAYVKTNWQTGDVITAAKLNNMETGIYDATEAAADAFVADIDDPQDGDVIKYDSTSEKWVNGSAAAFDPDIDDPQNGDVIKYDSTAEKWVNGSAGGGVVTVGSVDTTEMTVSLDKTAGVLWTAFTAGRPIIATIDDVPPFSVDLAFGLIYAVDKGNQGYSFTFHDGENLWVFDAENAQAYPTHSLS